MILLYMYPEKWRRGEQTLVFSFTELLLHRNVPEKKSLFTNKILLYSLLWILHIKQGKKAQSLTCDGF